MRKLLMGVAFITLAVMLSGCVGAGLAARKLSHQTLLGVVQFSETEREDGYRPLISIRRAVHWSDEMRDYRWTQVGYRDGYYTGYACDCPALIPDHIPYPLMQGSIVKLETADLTSVDVRKLSNVPRIVEVVCFAHDKECIQEIRRKHGRLWFHRLGPSGLVDTSGFTFTPNRRELYERWKAEQASKAETASR